MNAATRASIPARDETRADGRFQELFISAEDASVSSGSPGPADRPTGSQPAPSQPAAQGPSPELLASLTGHDGSREAAVGYRTRRVVLSSLGVLREQKENRTRARGVALAAAILVPLLIAPLVWEATDSFIAGEHLGDPGSELSLWATVFCCTLLAAVLVAGWMKRRA